MSPGGNRPRRLRPTLRGAGARRYVLDESLGSLVHRADRVLVSNLMARFGRRDVTVEQWKVLNRLIGGDGITQRELARRNAQDPTTLARILDKMEMKGLVERRDDRQDRRACRITLTPKGRRLHAELVPLALGALEDATAGMTAREVRELKRLLRLLFETLAPQHRDAAPVADSPDPRPQLRRAARITAAPPQRRSPC